MYKTNVFFGKIESVEKYKYKRGKDGNNRQVF